VQCKASLIGAVSEPHGAYVTSDDKAVWLPAAIQSEILDLRKIVTMSICHGKHVDLSWEEMRHVACVQSRVRGVGGNADRGIERVWQTVFKHGS
jgi:hypothetical protein